MIDKLSTLVVFRTIRHYYRNNRNRLFLVTGLLILASFAEAIGIASLLPVIGLVTQPEKLVGLIEKLPLGQTFAKILGATSQSTLLYVLLSVLVATAFIKATLTLLAIRSAGYTMSRIARDYRLRLVEALVAARWSYYADRRSGALVNAITTEPDRAAQCFTALTRFLASFFQVAFYGLLALSTSYLVTLSAVVIGTMLYLVVRVLSRLHRVACIEQINERSRLSNWLNDAVASMKSLKAMNLGHALALILDGAALRLERLMQREILSKAALQYMTEPTFTIVLAAGVIVFTQIYPLDIAMLMFMALLFLRIMGNISQIFSNYQLVNGSSGVMERLENEIGDIEKQVERNDGRLPGHNWHVIKFDDVTFSYGENTILSQFSTNISRGKLTVIKGPSGSGKTTLIDHVVGLTAPDKGMVLIGDDNMAELSLRDWRSRVGYVPQDTLLLNSSIRHNLCLDGEKKSDETIWQALNQAGLKDVVKQMPDGLESSVGERGNMLSGGQRQRLAIARALIRKPDLLILDEATSALDEETSNRIARMVSELSGDVTTIVVTHKDEFNQFADTIIDMSVKNKITNSAPA